MKSILNMHGPAVTACTYSVKLLNLFVIIDFADKTTEDIFHGLDSKHARRIPRIIWRIAVRKLDMLHAAHDIKDLRIPPANRLEALKGKWVNYYSIRINDQYRLVFHWMNNNAKDVFINDYH